MDTAVKRLANLSPSQNVRPMVIGHRGNSPPPSPKKLEVFDSARSKIRIPNKIPEIR